MFWRTLLLLLAAVCCVLPSAAARSLSVDIITDNGELFPVYPVNSRDDSYRAYVEARPNARYGIRISNHTGRRLDLRGSD